VLLLFDIDGTLVGGATDAHRDALFHALEVVHGVDGSVARRSFDPSGRTDGEIARMILLDAGVSAARIDERAAAVHEHTCRAYAHLCPPDLSDKVLPGIPELLDWLSGSDRALLGLLTGNYEPVAKMKLARAGIASSFRSGLGAFGSDSEDRAALPALARRRAGLVGAPYPRDRTVVIGDTPRDIACARADGVGCIAVSTGQFGPPELGAADAVVSDAWELRDELAALFDL
jgi:phosphoglycolate phosphatase